MAENAAETKKEEAPADAAPAAAEDDGAAKEEESTATFEPVVKLEEVEVQTGEEDEETLYSQRSKLYIFAETMLDAGTGKKTWKERGIGEIRIMRHKEHQKCRMLMRQEKTMKILMNHLLVPGLVLVPHQTSDQCLVWRANDFAEGELKETDFCIKFKNSDIADAFKVEFEKYQKEMEALESGADKPGEDGGAAADEAAEALKELSTNK